MKREEIKIILFNYVSKETLERRDNNVFNAIINQDEIIDKIFKRFELENINFNDISIEYIDFYDIGNYRALNYINLKIADKYETLYNYV